MLLIIIPTYNEKNNIETLSRRIRELRKGFHILFIDDNSPDGTGQLAEELSKKYEEVRVIHREAKMGLGTAYVTGFKYALEQKYDSIFQMDSDLSHDPKYLPVLLETLRDCDMVITSRFLGKFVHYPFLHLIKSFLANKYIQIFTGMKYTDCLGGFKAFNRNVLLKLDLNKFVSRGYVFQSEMLYKIHKQGFRIKEMPISFTPRKEGKSKMSLKVILEAVLKAPIIPYS